MLKVNFSGSVSNNTGGPTHVRITKRTAAGGTTIADVAPGQNGSFNADFAPGDQLIVSDAPQVGEWSCSGTAAATNAARLSASFDATGSTLPVELFAAEAAEVTASASFSLSAKSDMLTVAAA